MCGIAGMVGAGPEIGKAMIGTLRHRGPDSHGIWYSPADKLVLAQSRLSIIDLSSGGHQPMVSEDGRYVLVFNGEIYNYRELRTELESMGVRFLSASDTEVILRGYTVWGDSVVPRLRGMFAFALWDSAEKKLFCSRDRFGIKPFVYARKGDKFAFASELKALRQSGLVSPSMDSDAVRDFLRRGAVTQPRTILCDATMLPPGTTAVFDALSGAWSIHRYWELAEAASRFLSETRTISYSDAVRRVRGLLDDATRAHMLADVPVGAFLSGGIDSTAVVALMARQSSRPIRTYSIGFSGKDEALSELAWARLAAARIGTEHEEIVLGGAEVAARFEDILHHMEQPSVDGVNTYFVSAAARKGVTVTLSGIGGDELFAGYPQFHRFLAASGKAGNPALARALRPLLSRMPGRIARPMEYSLATPIERLARVRRLHDEVELSAALSPGLRSAGGVEPVTEYFSEWMKGDLDPVNRVSLIELSGYMRDTLLRDSDVMSMAHSLEIRPILLDHPLAEFAYALPSEFKLKPGGTPKRVFTEACADLIPQEIVNRPKMGFELPLLGWMRGELRDRVRHAIEDPRARSVFSVERLARVRAAVKGERRCTVSDWGVFVLCSLIQNQGLEPGW